MDVVISNCVINLSVDKHRVLAEMFRVLAPGGRIGVSDVVADDELTPAERAARGSYVGCIAGALSRAEYVDGLAAAGFVDVSVRFAPLTVSSADLLSLAVGDVLLLRHPPDAPLEVTTNDVTFAYAIASNHRRRLAAAAGPAAGRV